MSAAVTLRPLPRPALTRRDVARVTLDLVSRETDEAAADLHRLEAELVDLADRIVAAHHRLVHATDLLVAGVLRVNALEGQSDEEDDAYRERRDEETDGERAWFAFEQLPADEQARAWTEVGGG